MCIRDRFGNILIQTTASGIDSPDPNTTDVAVVQRILSTGEIDTEFGLGGAAVVGNAFEVSELAFDSQNRLIVAGDDLTRFEI